MSGFGDVVMSSSRLSFSVSLNMEATLHRATKAAVARLNVGKAANRIGWESGMLDGRAWFFFTFAEPAVQGWRRLLQPSTSTLQHMVLRGIRDALADGGVSATGPQPIA